MTDYDPLDDLASAHLDGATTPAEASRVATDPDLLARVEALRAVQAAMASAAPVDVERREQAIAAALAAYDDDAKPVTDTDAADLASVRDLTPVAARRRGSSRSWRIAGVAAAVAVAAVLVPLLASLSSESSDDSTNEAVALDGTRPEAEDSGGAADTLPGAGALEEADPTSTTAAILRSLPLGAFDDDDDLVAVARSASSASSASGYVAPATVADATGCLDDLLAALPADVDLLLTATAILDGRPVDVVVTPDDVRIAGGDCTDVLITRR